MSGSVRQGKKDIAVIIPTYDRPERLSNCLQALCDTDESFSRERFEVIVVDDGSSHSLQSIVEQYARRLEITYIRQPNSGPAAARNRGALAADSRYLCFTDDDCLPAKDWLPQLYSRLENAYEAVLGGRIINVLSQNLCSETSQQITDFLYSYYFDSASQPEEAFFLSSNLSCSTELFRAIGGFDENFRVGSEDRDFCKRCLLAGKTLVYVPEAIVYHQHDLNLSSLCKQHRAYGYGGFRYDRKHYGGPRSFPLRFYLRLCWEPIKRFGAGKGAPLCALLAVSRIADATGYLTAALTSAEKSRDDR